MSVKHLLAGIPSSKPYATLNAIFHERDNIKMRSKTNFQILCSEQNDAKVRIWAN